MPQSFFPASVLSFLLRELGGIALECAAEVSDAREARSLLFLILLAMTRGAGCFWVSRPCLE